MPFENLNSNHYLETEMQTVADTLITLESVLMPRVKNLSADERKKYGSINEQNKLVVNKTRDYRGSQPNLCSPDVDWEEFQADFNSRAFLEQTIGRLQKIVDGLHNNKILHDFDNYQAALTDYGYSQYKAGTKVPGYESKVNEVSQFFNRTGSTSKPAEKAPKN